jgi:putative membrane protein
MVIIYFLVGLIALEHLYFLWLEMFAWTSRGPKVFKKLPPETFLVTKSLAANQGLYNGFLAAGLIWSLLIRDDLWQGHVMIFFLSCVIIAGLYGAFSADRKIFVVQALPALVAMAMICFWR